MRPRIAVNCDVDEESGRSWVYLSYVDFVVQSGGMPVIVPPVSGAEDLLREVDGALLVGGDDYRCSIGRAEPPHFVPVAPRREEHDLRIVDRLLDEDIPTLGICGGFQLQVIVGGGSLFGDLQAEAPSSVLHRRARPEDPLPEHAVEWAGKNHALDVAPGMYRVNSHHHQAVRALPSDWSPLACAEDGVVEAAVGPGSFVVGVQWHPEKALDHPLSRRLGAGLIQAAQMRRGS